MLEITNFFSLTPSLHLAFIPPMARTFSEHFAGRVEAFLSASGFKPTIRPASHWMRRLS
jgi:hypothetical protein